MRSDTISLVRELTLFSSPLPARRKSAVGSNVRSAPPAGANLLTKREKTSALGRIFYFVLMSGFLLFMRRERGFSFMVV